MPNPRQWVRKGGRYVVVHEHKTIHSKEADAWLQAIYDELNVGALFFGGGEWILDTQDPKVLRRVVAIGTENGLAVTLRGRTETGSTVVEAK
jgi:hypothetical protein